MSESTLPSEIHCLNCSELLAGVYCAKCGQEDKEVRRPFLYFLQEFLRVAFELDGRAYRTIYYLFTRPGHLTKEFFAGRRISYTPPLRLFLIISIGFFLIVGIVSSIQSLQLDMSEVIYEDTAVTEETTEVPLEDPEDTTLQISVGNTELEIDPDDEDSFSEENRENIREQFSQLAIPFFSEETNQNLGRFMAEQIIANIEEVIEGPREFLIDSLEYLTFFILLMMPVLALVQKILFVFTKKYYIEHLVLTMHNHAFLFVIIFLMIIVGAIEDTQITYLSAAFNFIGIALLIWMFLYLYLSLKFYFERGYFLTGVLFFTVTIIYGIVSSIGLAIFAAAFFILS
ncbi:MAG: DUF3667 domain-containing protein [Pseudomonadales bacterium]|nr:DUF3667 domain-containing protein [Pseudomonadales bacterium]